MKAHEVRRLCSCRYAGSLVMSGYSVRAGPMECLAHDRCVYDQLGKGILNLPQEERVKFTLGAVGSDMMRRLIAALNKS